MFLVMTGIFRSVPSFSSIIEWASAQVPPTPLYLGGTVGRERERQRGRGRGRDGWRDGWMDGWMDRSIDRQTDRQVDM